MYIYKNILVFLINHTIGCEAKTFLPRFFTQQQLAIFTTPHPQKCKDYEPRPTA
jgi:hypothetical protein